MKLERIALIGLGIFIGLLFNFTVKHGLNARKEIENCKTVGGEPVYDLCFENPKLIKLPGIDYAPEVEEYK